MKIEKSKEVGYWDVSGYVNGQYFVSSRKSKKEALESFFDKVSWYFGIDENESVENIPCKDDVCDGSGFVTEGKEDDLNKKRCICNPKDDDSDDPIKFACHN